MRIGFVGWHRPAFIFTDDIMNRVRLCANESCGKQFETEYDNKIYCSSRCKQCAEHRSYRHKHKEQFKAYNHTPKREAYMKAYRKKYYLEHKNIQSYMRKCVKCGKEFETDQNRAIYCSSDCKNTAYNERRRPTMKEYNKEYYIKNRAKLIAKAELYRETHKDKYRETQKRLYDAGKASKLRECVQCGRRFRPTSKINVLCSDTCRVKRLRSQNDRYYNSSAPIKRFYDANPTEIYMPERKKLLESHRHKGTIAKWRVPTRHEARKQDMTVEQAIAINNFKFHLESDNMERIDLETLSGLPSEHKDAIIKALFDALKAKKTEEAKPIERKVTQKGLFYAEVNKMQTGQYISLFELMARAGTSGNEYMKEMNIFRALKSMPEGVLDIQACKIGTFPDGWLEANLYKKRTKGWHKKNKV